MVYQDNEANTANVATALLAVTHGGALRTGIATSAATIGKQVQVAVEGAATVPIGTIKVNGAGQPMTPGARYYATYDGGISPSSDDGVLLGRALRDSLLLLERDFAGGFRVSNDGAAQSSAFAGEIRALGGATIPAGWLICDGSAIDRVDFSTLFAALGITWGAGDGSSTFNIPDLRGRSVIGAGQGTSLTKRSIGDKGGVESVTVACGHTSGSYSRNDGGLCKGTHTINTMSPYAIVRYIIKT